MEDMVVIIGVGWRMGKVGDGWARWFNGVVRTLSLDYNANVNASTPMVVVKS